MDDARSIGMPSGPYWRGLKLISCVVRAKAYQPYERSESPMDFPRYRSESHPRRISIYALFTSTSHEGYICTPYNMQTLLFWGEEVSSRRIKLEFGVWHHSKFGNANNQLEWNECCWWSWKVVIIGGKELPSENLLILEDLSWLLCKAIGLSKTWTGVYVLYCLASHSVWSICNQVVQAPGRHVTKELKLQLFISIFV